MSLIEIDRKDGWTHLVLNRPEKRNALSTELLDELEAALLDADSDDSVHATLISANGTDFCGGFDLHDGRVESVSDDPMKQIAVITRGRRVMRMIPDLQKPVVARVHGRCLAGGTELAFVCDLVYASDDAEFGYPPVRDMGTPATPMWMYHAGPQWAKRLLLTGDSIGAADAASIGLILKSLPSKELDRELDGLMSRFTRIDWQLLAAQKRIVNIGLELMGAPTLYRSASMLDVFGLQSPTSRRIRNADPEELVAIYKTRRTEMFGDGRLSVHGPDNYDDDGLLR